MKTRFQILPPQPIDTVNPAGQILPTDSLKQIEAAALQLLNAVRQAQGGFSIVQNPPTETASPFTVLDLCNEFLLAKARAGRSDNYLELLVKELRSFANGRENRPVFSVGSAEIETWLHGQGWKPRTQRGRLLTLRTLFAWSVTRGQIPGNPALGVDLPALDNEPPGIHTPEQARSVLETARRLDLDAMRCLAVRYFAGLRTSEAVALEESEIKGDFVEVTAKKSKTRRRRLVAIQPALRAWLALGGTLPLEQAERRLRAVTLAAGVPWPHNAARHSFVSYHLAEFGNAGKTALEAGHTEQMLFQHYREIVTPEQSAAFWGLRP